MCGIGSIAFFHIKFNSLLRFYLEDLQCGYGRTVSPTEYTAVATTQRGIVVSGESGQVGAPGRVAGVSESELRVFREITPFSQTLRESHVLSRFGTFL